MSEFPDPHQQSRPRRFVSIDAESCAARVRDLNVELQRLRRQLGDLHEARGRALDRTALRGMIAAREYQLAELAARPRD